MLAQSAALGSHHGVSDDHAAPDELVCVGNSREIKLGSRERVDVSVWGGTHRSFAEVGHHEGSRRGGSVFWGSPEKLRPLPPAPELSGAGRGKADDHPTVPHLSSALGERRRRAACGGSRQPFSSMKAPMRGLTRHGDGGRVSIRVPV